MKKFTLIMFVIAMAMSSCTKEEEVKPTIKKEIQTKMEGPKQDLGQWD